jgi:hypothetical protein
MDTQAHTPGPWTWNGKHSIRSEQGPEGVAIAQAVTAADARLIAAAPDMLAFIRAFRATVEYSYPTHARTPADLLRFAENIKAADLGARTLLARIDGDHASAR